MASSPLWPRARGPGSENITRWTARYLCQELAGVTLHEFAGRFGLKGFGYVSFIIRKL